MEINSKRLKIFKSNFTGLCKIDLSQCMELEEVIAYEEIVADKILIPDTKKVKVLIEADSS